MVVAQEVDGLAVLPGDGSPAPEFIPAFRQPPVEFLGVVLVAWHDGAHGQDSQFILQQVEEHNRVVKAVHEQHVVLVGELHNRVVKAVHEQHVVLVGELRVLHETAENTDG